MAAAKVKKPGKLKIALANDTGIAKGANKDKITSDANLKLGKIASDTTLEWRDSPTGIWQTVTPSLLNSGILDASKLLDGDFTNTTLELRQTNSAGSSSATKIKFTYDTTAPELIEVIPPEADSIANNKSQTIRIISNEKLVGLDTTDFSISDNTLASIKSIKEVKLKDGTFAYDVVMTAAKNGSGEVSVTFSENLTVTDIAGNAANVAEQAGQEITTFWVGGDTLTISLVEDTTPAITSMIKKASTDKVTHNGEISITGIRPDATVEFRIKSPEDIGWVSLEGLESNNSKAIIDLADLYELAGLSVDDDMLATGWKDTFEFRQVTAASTSASTAFSFTYDTYAEALWGDAPDSEEIAPKTSFNLQLVSDEKLFGWDKSDFSFDPALVSFSKVSESIIKEDDYQYYAYNIQLKTTSNAQGELAFTLAETATVFDLAGNQVTTDIEPYLLFIG